MAAKRQSASGSGSGSKIDILSSQIEAFNRLTEEKLKVKNEKLKIEEAKVLAIDTAPTPKRGVVLSTNCNKTSLKNIGRCIFLSFGFSF